MQSATGSSKISFEESLEANVTKPGKCLACGACVIVCPFGCLEVSKEKSVLVNECKTCGICARICPRYDWSLPKLEKYVFGRERETKEEFGIYRKLTLAQATDNKTLNISQDGGVVTALLVFALENGLIDSAIVSGVNRERPFLPVPKLAVTSNEILECSGTRYSYSSNILALPTISKQKKEKTAFVGTPCQIQAIRRIEMAGLKKYTAPIRFVIGLMCSECFNYEELMEKHLRGTLGINLHSIKKMNIKGKMLVATESEVKTISLAEVKQYARQSCKPCDDFSSELADISVGGLGLNMWTFTVIRTERGEALFSSAEKAGVIRTRNVNEEPNALNLLSKLSTKKRQSSFSK